MKLLTQPFRKSRRPTANSQPSMQAQLATRFPDSSPQQREIMERVAPLTMTSPERILALCDAVAYILENRIQGDFVECGVWRGGSMAAVSLTLLSHSISDRQLWMYDTYEGMSAPSDEDVDLQGRSANSLLMEEGTANAESPDSVWCRCSLEDVQQNLRSTGYPESNIRYVKGKVEDTLANERPDQIALLRLDTDWYESTRCELQELFPRLVPGGVIIIDDYGHWQGCRRAVDEYFAEQEVKMFLHRVDYTGRLGIKLA